MPENPPPLMRKSLIRSSAQSLNGMNHLAHFHLSFGDPGLVLGNWAGDMVKGRDWVAYPPDVQRGIRLHRAIDAFTDRHAATHRFSAQIRPFAGRYAPPVTDVLRDFLLTNCWLEFSGEPLQTFADGIYNILENRLLELPPLLRERTPRMIAGNWLASYGTLGGLEFVFQRMQKRLREPLDIAGLLRFVERERSGLLADFRVFYPELFEQMRHEAQGSGGA